MSNIVQLYQGLKNSINAVDPTSVSGSLNNEEDKAVDDDDENADIDLSAMKGTYFSLFSSLFVLQKSMDDKFHNR